MLRLLTEAINVVKRNMTTRCLLPIVALNEYLYYYILRVTSAI